MSPIINLVEVVVVGLHNKFFLLKSLLHLTIDKTTRKFNRYVLIRVFLRRICRTLFLTRFLTLVLLGSFPYVGLRW